MRVAHAQRSRWAEVHGSLLEAGILGCKAVVQKVGERERVGREREREGERGRECVRA